MKVKLIDFGGRIPTRAHYNDAGADIYCDKEYTVYPGEILKIPLGFGLELPDGLAGFIFPRTSLSAQGIVCELPPVDSGYRGEIHAIVSNISNSPRVIAEGDRIGQLVLLPITVPEFVTDLGENRNAGAFGSTGEVTDMLIDTIAEMLALVYDCPCNYGQTDGPDFSDILIQTHSEKWFEEHCKPEIRGTAVDCWKEILLNMTKANRIDKDTYYLEIAKVVAKRSTCLHRQYGAVIVNHDEIIATGYNGSPRGEVNCCDVGICYKDSHDIPRDPKAGVHGNQYGSCVAVHAEQNAIISAARKDMQGATLYLATLDDAVTPAPCNFCDRMIKNAGITRVVTG